MYSTPLTRAAYGTIQKVNKVLPKAKLSPVKMKRMAVRITKQPGAVADSVLRSAIEHPVTTVATVAGKAALVPVVGPAAGVIPGIGYAVGKPAQGLVNKIPGAVQTFEKLGNKYSNSRLSNYLRMH